MNDLVKNSVEARKNAIFSTYEVADEKMLKKIEELFKKIEEFASKYNDVMEFEKDFAASELNKEYTNIFVELSNVGNTKTFAEKVNDNYIVSELKYDATHAVRGRAYREGYSKALETPIIGDIINIRNKIDLFKKFKRNKKDNNVEDDENENK